VSGAADPLRGPLLHPVDLAINKVLALAGRDEPRDFVDILFVHARVLPLGAICWAAVGKDSGFTPLSLLAYVDYSSPAVHVRSLTGPSVMQVSTLPTNRNPVVWGRDSRSLYYVTPGGLTVIELQTSPTLGVAGRRMIRGFPVSDNYDLHPDGRTFVLASPVRATADIIVAVNWADEARRTWRASMGVAP